MSRDLAKTLTYMCLHLTIGFTIAFMLTGSLAVAGGIALVEPLVNSIAFYWHERAWTNRAAPFRLLHAHG